MSADRLKVKRDGPRGWHWIAASSFDHAVHELVDRPAPPAAEPAPAPEQKPKGGKAARKE